jgi:hypothetical protein
MSKNSWAITGMILAVIGTVGNVAVGNRGWAYFGAVCFLLNALNLE